MLPPTLLVSGPDGAMTLTPALKLLGLLRTDDGEEREENEARLRTARAGVGRLDRLIEEQPALADVARALRDRHRHRVHRYFGRQQRRRHERDEEIAARYRSARGAMLDAEREELLRLRDEGVIGDAVMRRIQHDLDLEQLLLGPVDPSKNVP